MNYIVFLNESGFPKVTTNYNIKKGKSIYETASIIEASKFCCWWKCEDARKYLDVTEREFSSYPLIPDNNIIEWWNNLDEAVKAEFPETKSYMDISNYYYNPAAYLMNPNY